MYTNYVIPDQDYLVDYNIQMTLIATSYLSLRYTGRHSHPSKYKCKMKKKAKMFSGRKTREKITLTVIFIGYEIPIYLLQFHC